MELSTGIAVIAVVLFLIYKYGTRNFNYFRDQGVPGPEPIPFFGNLWGMWKRSAVEYDLELVRKYGKVFGFFEGNSPTLFVADAEWIRAITIKDFDHFVNRRDFGLHKKYYRKMMDVLNDQDWKEVRSAVSPAFTTGKIKKMSEMMKKCCDLLVERLTPIALETGKFDAKEIFGPLTVDIISKCAFSMQIDNYNQEENPILKNAINVFSPPTLESPMIAFPFLFPKLTKMLGEQFFISKELDFFVDLLKDTVTERGSSSQKFDDFIDLAFEAIQASTKGENGFAWSDEIIEEIVVAQAAVFFTAGFETTATALTIASHVLAMHPEIQEKLYDQIAQKVEQHGDICHEMFLDFPYVDQVIYEILRLHSPGVRVERLCTKDFTFNGVTVKKGMVVSVPVYAVHYLEEYYPNPLKFDPDRWDPANKQSRNPYTFLPFGQGPRNCIGMRFAMEELKISLCTLLKAFKFVAVKETPEKLTFKGGFQLLVSPLKFLVGVELREQTKN